MANPKSATICLQPGCGMKTANDHGYCPRHARVCKKCGCRVSYNSTRCRACSIVDTQADRTEAIRKAMAGKPKQPLTRKEEVISIIADAKEAKSKGQFPRVCDDIISQNTKILQEMEIADYVRAKIRI